MNVQGNTGTHTKRETQIPTFGSPTCYAIRGKGEPKMLFKVVGTFKTALSRQKFEVVRIRGRTGVLNSRGEYDRCKIHRLTIEKKEEHHAWGGQRSKGTKVNNREVGTEGEHSLMDRRKKMDRD